MERSTVIIAIVTINLTDFNKVKFIASAVLNQLEWIGKTIPC